MPVRAGALRGREHVPVCVCVCVYQLLSSLRVTSNCSPSSKLWQAACSAQPLKQNSTTTKNKLRLQTNKNKKAAQISITKNNRITKLTIINNNEIATPCDYLIENPLDASARGRPQRARTCACVCVAAFKQPAGHQ